VSVKVRLFLFLFRAVLLRLWDSACRVVGIGVNVIVVGAVGLTADSTTAAHPILGREAGLADRQLETRALRVRVNVNMSRLWAAHLKDRDVALHGEPPRHRGIDRPPAVPAYIDKSVGAYIATPLQIANTALEHVVSH
jgi:hypothetical protein